MRTNLTGSHRITLVCENRQFWVRTTGTVKNEWFDNMVRRVLEVFHNKN